MAFNSNTYRMNKYRKLALADLAAARELKARVARGAAYEWEASRLAYYVTFARTNWRLYLIHRSMRGL